MSLPERREALRQQFMFSCSCARCAVDLQDEVGSNRGENGLAPADSALQYSVVEALFDQARSLWLQRAEGDAYQEADSNLIQARVLLKKLVAACEQEKAHKMLQQLLLRARDTLGSVLISLGLFAEARACLLEYVESVRLLALHTTPRPLGTADIGAADHGDVGRQASLSVAMRVLDLSMLESELGNESASKTHAKHAWAELVCVAGDAGATEIFSYRGVSPPP